MVPVNLRLTKHINSGEEQVYTLMYSVPLRGEHIRFENINYIVQSVEREVYLANREYHENITVYATIGEV